MIVSICVHLTFQHSEITDNNIKNPLHLVLLPPLVCLPPPILPLAKKSQCNFSTLPHLLSFQSSAHHASPNPDDQSTTLFNNSSTHVCPHHQSHTVERRSRALLFSRQKFVANVCVLPVGKSLQQTHGCCSLGKGCSEPSSMYGQDKVMAGARASTVQKRSRLMLVQLMLGKVHGRRPSRRSWSTPVSSVTVDTCLAAHMHSNKSWCIIGHSQHPSHCSHAFQQVPVYCWSRLTALFPPTHSNKPWCIIGHS